MSLLDDTPLKPDFHDWLVGPMNLLNTIFVEILPGMIFFWLMWAAGDHRIEELMKSGMFGYRTKVLLLLAACYVIGRILIVPAVLLAHALEAISTFLRKKGHSPQIVQPTSSGFQQWVEKQEPHFRQAVMGFIMSPLFLAKKSLAQEITVAGADAGFYFAVGNALLFAAFLHGNPFRWWELIGAVLLWTTAIWKMKRKENLVLVNFGLGVADMLMNMPMGERKALVEVIVRISEHFNKKPPNPEPPKSEAQSAGTTG